MSRFDPLKSAAYDAAELVRAGSDPEPRDFQRHSTSVSRRERNVERPDDDLQEYRRLYETNGLISTPIDAVVNKVFEAGYYVTADDDEDLVDELEEFCENIGYHAGAPKQDLRDFGRSMVTAYQVRGTFVCEKMTDDGKHQGLNPLLAETIEVYKKPGKNALVAPEDSHYDHVKKTEDGDAAAFVQFDDGIGKWGDRGERRFARDDIIHWARNPDANDVFGNSRVETVYERALALEAKMRDNDDAIAMKAWPMVLFQLGSEDRPWNRNEMTDFMEKYSPEEFGPGMYHGVPGDVDVLEFAGETADIDEAVTTDVDMILAGMPGPKYSLGSFSDGNVGNSVAASQERQYRELARSLRRDVEDLLTPYLRDVAVSYDLISEDDDIYDEIQLHIGRPAGDVAPEDINGNIIRYTSDVSDDGGQKPEATGGEVIGEDAPAGPQGPGDDQGGANAVPDMSALSSAELSERNQVDLPDWEGEELADPRLVSTVNYAQALSGQYSGILQNVRDSIIDTIATRDPSDLDGETVRSAVGSTFGQAFDEAGGDGTSQVQLDTVARETLSTLRQDSHTPRIDRQYDNEIREVVVGQRNQFKADLRNVVGEMTEAVRREQSKGGQWEQRVRQQYDADSLRNRARHIAHMRIQQTVNSVKLQAYRDDDRVTGVRVINPCTQNTTNLCRDLAGCDGDAAIAYFDDGDIGAQLADQTSARLFAGFSPLPPAPPYHHGCRSELAPIVE